MSPRTERPPSASIWARLFRTMNGFVVTTARFRAIDCSRRDGCAVARRHRGREKRFLQEDVGVVQAALDRDRSGQKEVAGLAGEGEVGIQPRLEVAEDLADGAPAPADGIAQPDFRRLDRDADVLDGKAGQPGRAFHRHRAAPEGGGAFGEADRALVHRDERIDRGQGLADVALRGACRRARGSCRAPPDRRTVRPRSRPRRRGR